MKEPVLEGTLLWQPSVEWKKKTHLFRYMETLREERNQKFEGYAALWDWSVRHLEDFWASIWEFAGIQAAKPYKTVLSRRAMPGAQWFEGAELNYAAHVFRHRESIEPAILFRSERHPLRVVSWKELVDQTKAVAAFLKECGVRKGDRVVAYMPNIPETVIAFLACASIGAIWSGCSPDFGAPSVMDRFRQIEPKVLFAADGYPYNGNLFDRRNVVKELQARLPSLTHTVWVPYLYPASSADGLERTVLWEDLPVPSGPLEWEPVPFDHPLWVLYSSGTTGIPKAIVQGHGGILLEHCKSLLLHSDIHPGDRFFRYTSTGWMMWNILVGGLLVGATIILYDGSPVYPDKNVLWELAEQTEMTFFGASAAYLTLCMKEGLSPGKRFDLRRLKGVGSTGSPLSAEGFRWVYEQVKPDLHLSSSSGGTDVCTAFVGGCPILPVYAGQIQCRCLGVKAEAFDDDGRPVVGEMGELVITEPMPSMPLFFWNDPGDARYRESYFSMFPGVWRHGDWIKINADGQCVIYGRSDSTINRHGVRMGTSEIYRALESMDEIADSLVADLELLGHDSGLLLFVVMREGAVLDTSLKERIKEKIRREVSPRHVPDAIYEIREVPRTLNGKKIEVPIRKILLGFPLDKAVNLDALSNPESIHYFVDLAERRKQGSES
jgi:acetoacetyl-CoA synthetase